MAQESGSGNWRRLPGPFSCGPIAVLRADPSAESAAQRGLVDRVAEPLADEQDGRVERVGPDKGGH